MSDKTKVQYLGKGWEQAEQMRKRAAQAEADAADLLKAYREQKETIETLRRQLEQAHSALKEIIEDVVNHPGEFDADSEIVRIAREAIA